jgi:hypothetical protein
MSLRFSELTGRVYWVAGNRKVDVTRDVDAAAEHRRKWLETHRDTDPPTPPAGPS